MQGHGVLRKEALIILGILEYQLVVVAGLDDVVRLSGDDQAG